MSIATKIDLTEAVDAMARSAFNNAAKAMGDTSEDAFASLDKNQQRNAKEAMLDLLLPAVPFIAASAVREAISKTPSYMGVETYEVIDSLYDTAEEFGNA